MRNSRNPRLMFVAASMCPSRYSSGSRTSMTTTLSPDLSRRSRSAGPSSGTTRRASASISLRAFMARILPHFRSDRQRLPFSPSLHPRPRRLLYSQNSMANARKGIILAGGSGSRLYPLTLALSKQLVPIYNKPMIYYPLSTLMLAGIRTILVITTPQDQGAFQRLLGDGGQLGLRIEYATQPRPEGLAQAFVIGRRFVGDATVALALGDNVFYGHGLPECLTRASERATGATVFAYWVRDPERYGVVEFDAAGRPSARGELEITDVNLAYLAAGALHVEKLGRGIAWLDTGTHEALLQASTFIQTIEERQGLMVACVEEIAYRLGWITAADVARVAKPMKDNAYGQYLFRLVEADT